ncbi:hypothetical protein AB1Y20_015612 [Prymnesium parvum]|uniref:Uncharacterized protein n=1 Tax=Prymnesium parvum TaxID=97485 RepID=A0AB34K204_PRYPA
MPPPLSAAAPCCWAPRPPRLCCVWGEAWPRGVAPFPARDAALAVVQQEAAHHSAPRRVALRAWVGA